MLDNKIIIGLVLAFVLITFFFGILTAVKFGLLVALIYVIWFVYKAHVAKNNKQEPPSA